MLINRIKSNLYAMLVLRMFAALVLSILVFIGMIITTQFVIKDNITEIYAWLPFGESHQMDMHDKAFNIQEEINNIELSLDEAIESYSITDEHFEQYLADTNAHQYLLILMVRGKNYEDRITTGVTEQGITYESFNNSFLYKINVDDTEAYLMLFSDKGDVLLNIIFLIVFFSALGLFFVLSLKFVKPIFDYIKDIEEGVKIIASDDLTYRIDLKGNNELTSLASEINDMGIKIFEKTENEKMLDHNQRVLITNISHDLRTPLTSIIGYVDLIEKNVDEPEALKEYAYITKNNVIRLEKLVNDLFLYTKLTSNDVQLDIAETDINMIIRQVIEMKSHSFNFISPNDKLYVNLDINKFLRILENLFSNAEKYGLKDRGIEVKSYVKDHEVCVEISNQTSDDLEDKMLYLLNRLYVANEGRSQGSSGLGLSIVKELVEKMNGEIDLDFNAGIFTVTLRFIKAR